MYIYKSKYLNTNKSMFIFQKYMSIYLQIFINLEIHISIYLSTYLCIYLHSHIYIYIVNMYTYIVCKDTDV